MTAAQHQRKIAKLYRLHSEVISEARNTALSSAERSSLARAADALRDALRTMEAA